MLPIGKLNDFFSIEKCKNLRVKLLQDKGFTLIELIVVLVLISMMTALAVPRFRQAVFDNRLNKSSRILVGLIGKVARKAARDQQEYQLNFDPSQNRIWLEGSLAKSYAVTLQEGVELAGVDIDIPEQLNSGNKYGHDRSHIIFTAKGYVTKTLIHLRDEDSKEVTIYLSPFIGVTKIFDSSIDFQDESLH